MKAGSMMALKSEICPVKNNAKSIYTFTHDDGCYDATTKCYSKWFKELDLRGSIGLVYSHIDMRRLNGWKEVISDGNIDVVCHSYSHKALNYPSVHPSGAFTGSEIKNDAIRKKELVTSQRKLRRLFSYKKGKDSIVFPDQEIICYTTPENTMDAKSHLIAEQHYYSIRKGTVGYNPLDPKDGKEDGDWYNLMIFNSGDPEMLGRYKPGDDSEVKPYTMASSIKTALDLPCWVIEMWHSLFNENPKGYQNVLDDYARVHFGEIRKLRDSGIIWVATLGEATKYIRERQNATIKDETTGGVRTIKLEMDTGFIKNKEDIKYFKFPLTIKSEVPKDWSSVIVTQADKAQNLTSIEEDGNCFVYYDAVPGAGDINIHSH